MAIKGDEKLLYLHVLRHVVSEDRNVAIDETKLCGNCDQHHYYSDTHMQRKCAKIDFL